MSVNGRPQPMNRQQSAPPALHDMYRVVSLFNGHQGERKFYCQSYVWKRTELSSDGKGLHSSDPASQWDLWFIQLTGVEFSMWNAKEMEAAAQRGDSIGPTFLRVQHANVSIVDVQQSGPPQPDCRFAFALNTAGSNRILLVPVPDQDKAETPELALRKWVNCVRLACWETARLNEIFTGTMLGLRGETFCKSPLQRGRFEESVEVMLPGDTEWRRVHLVIQDGAVQPKQKKRMSFLHKDSSSGSIKQLAEGPAGAATAEFFASRKSKRPFFTFTSVRYVAAIYPENQKMIPNSAVLKMEGFIEWDMGSAELPPGLDLQAKRLGSRAAAPKGEAWDGVMLMPSADGTNNLQVIMLTWVLAICDAFKLYGRRPPNYKFSFDPRGANSIYLGYPIGATRDHLYHEVVHPNDLDPGFSGFSAIRDMNPRENRPSVIDRILTDRLYERVSRPNTEKAVPQAPPSPAPPAEQGQYQQPLQELRAPPQQHQVPQSSQPPTIAVIDQSPRQSMTPNNLAAPSNLPNSYHSGTLTASSMSPAPSRSNGSVSDDGRPFLTSSAHSSTKSGTSSSHYPSYSNSPGEPSALGHSSSEPIQPNVLPPVSSVVERPRLPELQTQIAALRRNSSGPQTSAAPTTGSVYSQTTATPGKSPDTSLPYHKSSPSTTTVRSESLGLVYEPPQASARQTSGFRLSPQGYDEKQLPAQPFSEGLNEASRSTSPGVEQLVPGALPISPMPTAAPQDKQLGEPASTEQVRQNSGSSLGNNADAIAAFRWVNQRTPSPPVQVSQPAPRRTAAVPISTYDSSRSGPGVTSRPEPSAAQPEPSSPASSDHYESTFPSPALAPAPPPASYKPEVPAESTFEKSRRVEADRQAQSRLAQESASHALHRPGKSKLVTPRQVGSYSSDEDEEPEEKSSDDEPVQPPPVQQPEASPIPLPRSASRSLPVPPGRASHRGAPSPAFSESRSAVGNRSSSYGRPTEEDPGYSTNDLLHAGVQHQAATSAKAQEADSREFGRPMVELPAPQGPPTSGLVGAIAEREKERKQTGGIGAAMTEREYSKRQADQEAAEAMRRSSMMGGFPPQGFMDPNMMSYMMPPGQMQPWQQQAMMAAQMAAQQAYMQTMMSMQYQMAAYQQQQSAGGSRSGASSPVNASPMPFAYPQMSPMASMGYSGSPTLAGQPFGGQPNFFQPNQFQPGPFQPNQSQSSQYFGAPHPGAAQSGQSNQGHGGREDLR